MLSEALEHGIARLSNTWQGKGESGLEFSRPGHLYQSDIQVLGEGSLFELLCTTRSTVGAERLATYLLDPVENEERKLRQECVKELRGAWGVRQEMNLLGTYRGLDCSTKDFEAWFQLPLLAVHWTVPLLLLTSSVFSILLGVGIWAHVVAWEGWTPWLAALLLLESGIALVLFPKVRTQVRQLRLMTNSFTVLWQGLALIERLQFQSPKLRAMAERLRANKASARVHTLEKLVRAFDQREKQEFYFISHLVAFGTQLILAVDRWRSAHQSNFQEWLHIWAEFEALQAIAGYAFEHPECVFPEFVESAVTLEVRQLGHPLLPTHGCVSNDIALN